MLYNNNNNNNNNMLEREHISLMMVEPSYEPNIHFNSISQDFLDANRDIIYKIVKHYTGKFDHQTLSEELLYEIVEILNPIFASEDAVFDAFNAIRNDIIDELIG